MDHISEKDIRTHVAIVGWGLIITNALLLLFGLGLFAMLAGIGLLSSDSGAFVVLALVGGSIGGVGALFSVPGIIAGWGLLERRNWARILAIVFAGLNALNFPVGTLIAVYVIWVLLQRSAEAYFGSQL
ncbi:MAG: hypothetical protein GXX93_07675 [Anaerolineae bacterium]|nr:hypothetical protein [Anaerolineae bacterium]